MSYYSKRFQRVVQRHLNISRDIAKHYMKIGKKETSIIISQKVEIENDGNAKLKTTIDLLPIRRMYNDGTTIVDDAYLLHEMEEDIEL